MCGGATNYLIVILLFTGKVSGKIAVAVILKLGVLGFYKFLGAQLGPFLGLRKSFFRGFTKVLTIKESLNIAPLFYTDVLILAVIGLANTFDGKNRRSKCYGNAFVNEFMSGAKGAL